MYITVLTLDRRSDAVRRDAEVWFGHISVLTLCFVRKFVGNLLAVLYCLIGRRYLFGIVILTERA